MAAFLPLTAIRTIGWRPWLTAVSVLLSVWGCSDPAAEENEALRETIIEVHDEAMDKIGYMFVLETRLKKLQPSPDVPADTLADSIAALQQANREMFGWMNQYQTLYVTGDITQDTRYRRQQLEKIEAVSTLTNEAIAAAEHILSAN